MPSKKRAPKTKTAAAPGPADELPSLDTLALERQAACAPEPSHLLDGLPDSVVGKIRARAEVRGLDLSEDNDAVRDLVETAREAYERKKAGSRASAAKRRSAAKAKAAPAALETAVEPPAPADAPAVEPPAEPLP